MTEFQLIPGHKITTDIRQVTRYSSSWNMDYEDTNAYLVCECGWEQRLLKFTGGEKQERLHVLEHSVAVMGEVLNSLSRLQAVKYYPHTAPKQ